MRIIGYNERKEQTYKTHLGKAFEQQGEVLSRNS